MKSYNHLYVDDAALTLFANEHKLEVDASSDQLITVFSSELDVKKNQKLLKQLKKLFPKAKITGATTAGEIVCKEVKTEEILISLHLFQKTNLIIHHVPLASTDEMFAGILSIVKDNTKGILMLPVMVANYFDIEMLLELIYGAIPDIPIFGGAAAEYGTFTQQYSFCQDKVFEEGISIVSFQSDTLSIRTDYSFNWKPVGQHYTITEVENNVVKKIDGRPAVEVVEENLGIDAEQLIPELGLDFPFVFNRKGVLMARVMIGIEGTDIILAAPVETDTVFQFSYGSRKNAIDHSLKLADKYATQDIESIMAFSCIARLNFLKSDAQKELSHLSDSANITGFFTYGEIYHSERSNYYLNETLTLAFFNEGIQSKTNGHPIVNDLKSIPDTKDDARFKILTHLVSKVTQELEGKNKELERNNEILRQYSKLIDDRNMEISQSLRYASKLQNSIVFQDDEFNTVFDEHFIFFQPKEEVSGDFYFIRDLGDKLVLAVADGTGHGVPGAFMSILGVQVMHSITRRMKNGREDLNAGEFLNMLRDKMKKILDRNRISKYSTDGLDISLLIINKETREVDFSGANQCIIIYNKEEMIQLKGDRMPIGAFVDEKSFSNTCITLEEGSKVYMYTDGYADQFGGKYGKKINSSQLRALIRKHSELPFSQMKEEFHGYFDNWKGEWEQTDDVLLVGFHL